MAARTLSFLTGTQVDAFYADGYLILGNVLSDDELRVLESSVAVLEDWAQTNEHRHFQSEPESTASRKLIRKIQAIHHHGGVPWRALMRKPATLDLFEDLLGSELFFHHSKLMMKPPLEGSAKHWHQDLSEGFVTPTEVERLGARGTDFRPEDVPVVAIQYYLDASTVDNGCIQVVPGSHRRGLHTNPLDESLIDPAEAVCAEVPAGGALLFHCLTYHYSAPNTSDKLRRAPVYEYFAPTRNVQLLPRQQDFGARVRPENDS